MNRGQNFATQIRSQSAMSSKPNDVALRCIQNDLGKMKRAINYLEQRGNQILPNIPNNLITDLNELQNQSNLLTNGHNQINYPKIKAKLNRLSDATADIVQKVSDHIQVDVPFNPSTSYITSFIEEHTNQIMTTAKQQCTNMEFCLEKQIQSLLNQSQPTFMSSPFLTEPPHLETVVPRVIYKIDTVSKRNEAVLSTMKEQTQRLANIYGAIQELESLPERKGNTTSFKSIIKLAEKDRSVIVDLQTKADILQTNAQFAAKRAQLAASVVKTPAVQEDLVIKSNLEDFKNMSEIITDRLKDEIKATKESLLEQIDSLRTKLDFLDAKLDQFGDFSGDSSDMLTYMSMKIDFLVSKQNKPDKKGIRMQKNVTVLKKFTELQTNIFRGSQKSAVADLNRIYNRLKFQIPLLDDTK